MVKRDRQRAERSKQVSAAAHSGTLEGREPSPDAVSDAQQYVKGTITAEDVLRRTRKRYGAA